MTVAKQGALCHAVNEHSAGIENVCVDLSHLEKTLNTAMHKLDANPLSTVQQADNHRGAVACSVSSLGWCMRKSSTSGTIFLFWPHWHFHLALNQSLGHILFSVFRTHEKNICASLPSVDVICFVNSPQCVMHDFVKQCNQITFVFWANELKHWHTMQSVPSFDCKSWMAQTFLSMADVFIFSAQSHSIGWHLMMAVKCDCEMGLAMTQFLVGSLLSHLIVCVLKLLH